MLIFPAIDLRGGAVVRLSEGDYSRQTTYPLSPVEAALAFMERGARQLHVVDLDGAKDGSQANIGVIRAIARETGMFIEVGGGARDEASVARYIEAGAGRVIIGTLAVENPRLFEHLAARYNIAAGIDARDGRIAIRGWKVITDIDARSFMRALPERGVNTAIFTDISRDGMLSGANIPAYEDAARINGLNVIASGGVTDLDDIAKLKSAGVYGAIIGKALYAGRIELESAIALAEGDE